MAFPRTVLETETSPNMGQAQGQIGCASIVSGAASSAAAASIAGISPSRPAPRPLFYRHFFPGTQLAQWLRGIGPLRAAAFGSLVMLSALGAASSALDILQSLTSKKTAAKPTTGVTQKAT